MEQKFRREGIRYSFPKEVGEQALDKHVPGGVAGRSSGAWARACDLAQGWRARAGGFSESGKGMPGKAPGVRNAGRTRGWRKVHGVGGEMLKGLNVRVTRTPASNFQMCTLEGFPYEARTTVRKPTGRHRLHVLQPQHFKGLFHNRLNHLVATYTHTVLNSVFTCNLFFKTQSYFPEWIKQRPVELSSQQGNVGTACHTGCFHGCAQAAESQHLLKL